MLIKFVVPLYDIMLCIYSELAILNFEQIKQILHEDIDHFLKIFVRSERLHTALRLSASLAQNKCTHIRLVSNKSITTLCVRYICAFIPSKTGSQKKRPGCAERVFSDSSVLL